MDTIEADLRMASNWGRNSRPLAVERRSFSGDPNPTSIDEPSECESGWALDLAMTVDGDNNGYTLTCGPMGGAQADSDVITVRRATVNPQPLEAGRLQIQTTRIQGELFVDGNVPSTFSPASSTTHNLLVNSYYVATNSALIPGVPTLRRKRLGTDGTNPIVVDEEVAPGVENLQMQLGIDVNGDNTVDRDVNPGHDAYTPGSTNYIPGARVITARVWLVVRGTQPELGIQDNTDYEPGDRDLGTYNDNFRRMMVSKTILLRNARI